MKECWKSVNICLSYGQLSTGLFVYETRCILWSVKRTNEWVLENAVYRRTWKESSTKDVRTKGEGYNCPLRTKQTRGTRGRLRPLWLTPKEKAIIFWACVEEMLESRERKSCWGLYVDNVLQEDQECHGWTTSQHGNNQHLNRHRGTQRIENSGEGQLIMR